MPEEKEKRAETLGKTVNPRKTPTTTRRHRPPGCASVIIPALNEARTIASVVRFSKRDPETAEVLVIDDGSVDGTPELAAEAGARRHRPPRTWCSAGLDSTRLGR